MNRTLLPAHQPHAIPPIAVHAFPGGVTPDRAIPAELQHVAGNLVDSLGDRVSMDRPQRDNLEYEHVELRLLEPWFIKHALQRG
jgi:hypothetical protein